MSVRPSVCPSVPLSVRPERFPGICRRMHGGIGLKFYMLMYRDHLQNWLVYGCGLLIFLILALFWLSETGQIWGFWAFPGERMEGMPWNVVCYCILTTLRTDQIMFTVWWFFSLYPRPTKLEGGGILDSPCPSVRLSVCLSVDDMVSGA